MKTHLLLAMTLVGACGGPSNPVTDTVDAVRPPADVPFPSDAIAARDPAGDGDATVVESTESIPGATASRALTATVYVPGSPAPHPLVIVSPGFQMARAQYASYAHHLATWGFTVVLTDYADSGFFADHQKLADDVSAVIDWALAEPTLAVDPQRIAAMGHSLGGKISVLAATQDPRIQAIVAWDPVDSQSPSVAPEQMTNLAAALAVVGETTNGTGGNGGMACAPAADNYTTFYAAAQSPALAVTVIGADHMDWVDDPACGFCGFCSPGSAEPALARTITRRVDVAWLRRHLFADTAMDGWLQTPPELAAGSASVVHK